MNSLRACEQSNPKTAGTLSYERYDKYKVAEDFEGMLKKGAVIGDLYHDWAMGFITVRT